MGGQCRALVTKTFCFIKLYNSNQFHLIYFHHFKRRTYLPPSKLHQLIFYFYLSNLFEWDHHWRRFLNFPRYFLARLAKAAILSPRKITALPIVAVKFWPCGRKILLVLCGRWFRAGWRKACLWNISMRGRCSAMSVRKRAGCAIATDIASDQPRVGLPQIGHRNAKTIKCPGHQILDKHISRFRSLNN